MGRVTLSKKACAENPLKSSAPLGAALAYLGVEGAVPLFHGAQGCTSFALVLAVRHYKEAIPLQTTALDEAATVLGGADHLEEAILVLKKRMNPSFIGIASTALTETRGEDFRGELRTILGRRKAELGDTRVVFASTPDFKGALEDGWAQATAALIDEVVEASPAAHEASLPQVNVLPGVHQTPADLGELADILWSFGLRPVFVPDVSGSLDGHVPDAYVGTSLGGVTLRDLAAMGRAIHTIAVGEHMRWPGERLASKTGVGLTVVPSLTGLEATDAFVALLQKLSGRTAGAKLRRQRSQLVDAMLDAHFHFAAKRIAVAADPDLLASLVGVFTGLGAEVPVAIASTDRSPSLEGLPCDVLVGDLADLEDRARAEEVDLLVTHSHGRQASERLGVPLFRVGFPIFDRLGAQHRCTVGYAGTRALVHELGNAFLAELHEPSPDEFRPSHPPLPIIEDTRHVVASS